MRMLPSLAVQLYTFRQELENDAARTLAGIASAGFRAVEPYGIGSADNPVEHARKLRGELDAAGLRALAAHANAPLDGEAERVLDAVAELGATTLVIPSPGAVPGFGKEVFADTARIKQLGERLTEAADNAARRGIRFAYHNHFAEFTMVDDDRTAYSVLLESAGPEVDLELDVYWAQGGGVAPRELVAELGERVRFLHVKDGTGEHGVDQVPVGSGQIDNRGAIESGTGVRWHIIEFDRCATDRLAAATASGEWLATHGLSTWELPDA